MPLITSAFGGVGSNAPSSPHRSKRYRFEKLESRMMLAADFQITEFLASNNSSFVDEDGDDSDWLEVANVGDAIGSLNGWYLTDNDANLTKWQIPDVSLAPQERLIVWASNKDRSDPFSELHTSFKLGAGGEYLALIEPDGFTIASEFAPEFPAQFTDVSYGFTETAVVTTTLVDSSTPVQVLVPPNGSLGTTWRQIGFSPGGSWISGPGMGVGYDTNPDYLPLINTDVRTAMHNVNGSAYIRAEFNYSASTQGTLGLKIKYDDGFVGYLNGQQIVSRNAPGNPAWNSSAIADRIDSLAIVDEVIDLSEHTDLLVVGTNVFAIHGLNVVSTSSDFLIDGVLELSVISYGALRYFVEPSPGESNVAASLDSSPFLENVSHGGGPVADNQNIVVTAKVTPQGAAVQSVMLHYRIMFGSESTTAMFDDGLNGDGASGDGVYGASVAHQLSNPGEMVRYYVTASDTNGNSSRFPYFQSPDSSEYAGTVIADPGVSSQLPIYEWFVQDPNWFRNGNGTNNYNTTSASLFYNGVFYDNVIVNTKGRTSGQDNAPKFEFTLASGTKFIYSLSEESVKKFDLAAIYQDPSASRLTLGFEVFREAGSYGPLAFPVHTRMNGAFYRLSIFVERIKAPFLRRNGLDSDGAVYKADGVYSGLTLLPGADIGTTNGMEKINRDDIDPSFSDLQDLIAGVSPSNPDRQQYLLDNVDLPEFFNTLAMYAITKHYDSATHNYYVYRDSDGDGLWSLLPWDFDLIWDRLYEPVFGQFFSGHPYIGSSSEPSWTSNHWNKLIDAVVDSPLTQELYLRRLRTLMDQILQPPGTPLANRVLENRVDNLVTTLSTEALASQAIWGQKTGGSWGNLTTLQQGVDHLKSMFDDRRSYLYGLGIIPSAQLVVSNLTIGDFDSNPSSGNQGEEYIEIVNPNNFAVDISGWSLTSAVDHSFFPGTVVPSLGSLYVVRDLVAFGNRTSGPSTGQGLVIQGDYIGGLSTIGEILELRNDAGVVIDTEVIPAASADFDGNGVVDGTDFLAWQLGYGLLAPAATLADGDADFDENVDADDLTVWEAQYGTTTTLAAVIAENLDAKIMPASLASNLTDVAIVWSQTEGVIRENSQEQTAESIEFFTLTEGSDSSPTSVLHTQENRTAEVMVVDEQPRSRQIAEELLASLLEEGALDDDHDQWLFQA